MDKVELPDFEDIANVIEKIREVSIKKSLIDLEIKVKEAEINIEATRDTKYFVNKKPPSQEYIKNSWRITGFDNELLKPRKHLVTLSAELEYNRLKLALLNNLVDIWRTQSANERILL
jgi:frataxin-like iron-binding protein CyaY